LDNALNFILIDTKNISSIEEISSDLEWQLEQPMKKVSCSFIKILWRYSNDNVVGCIALLTIFQLKGSS
jgi:hypothetical protein